MVDYIKSGTAGTTNLAAAAGWTAGSGFPSSVTADTATWLASGPLGLGGTLTGNISARKVTVNEASANITHSGVLTLGADGFLFASGNSKAWAQNGTIAVGAINQTWTLCNTANAQTIWLSGATALSSSTSAVTVILANGSGVNSNSRAYILASGACAGFTGTIQLNDYTAIAANSTSNLTGANFIVNGVGCRFYLAAAGQILGAAGKTLTINQDVTLGFAGRSFTIAPNVVLAGTGTRTLTVDGTTAISGTVSGSNGMNLAGTSQYNILVLGSTLAGLSGPATLAGCGLDVPATAWIPSSLDIGNGSRFRYTGGTTDYNFPVTPTGSGIVSTGGNFAGNGVTYPASPAAGNIASFAGRVQAFCPSAGNSKVRISELPGSLGLVGYANASSPSPNASITYTGTGHSGAAGLVIDSEDNTSTSSLLGGTYSLISSGAGPIGLSGNVERTNSIGTTSARMSLTLGGSNTGDNTLSGVISEVGTNSATLGITKVDAGRWVLSGTNTYTGVNTISAGTLSAQSAAALGNATSTGGVTISGTGVLELAGGITLNKSVTDFTVSNATNPIQSVGDNTLQTKLLTLSTTPTFTVSAGNKLTLSPQGAGKITGAQGIAKSGDGTLTLSEKANDFTGGVVINAGVLEVGSVANANIAAAWGAGNSNPTVVNKGTLRYIGSGGSTTRTIRMDDAAPTLESSGSGALTVETLQQNSFAGTRDLTLGGSNTGDNEVTSSIADNGGTTNLVKAGAGKWVLSGALSYGGTTTVSDGTLRVETPNSNTNVGAVTIASSATVELVTDTAASSGGRVLGAGDVTVNGGTIKTRGGVVQKGSVRYNGNLTFNSGSKLYIGAAA